jgi:hypothetical protein
MMDTNAPTNAPAIVELPAPTAWPIVFSFGVTLIFAGLVTSAAITIVGALAFLVSAVGWFREVLPQEAEERVPVLPDTVLAVTERPLVARLETRDPLHRARLPIEIYPISAGVKGGLAGGAAMAILAMLYGVLSQHSIWYPINLLAAGFFPAALAGPTADIAAFDVRVLFIAIAIHLCASLLVGVLYGATLPMIPRRPILLGGVIAPLVWSGLLYSSLGIINPLLNARIHWTWFLLSQLAFGLIAGLVVVRQQRIRTPQDLPFAMRAGLETPGMMDDHPRGGDPR